MCIRDRSASTQTLSTFQISNNVPGLATAITFPSPYLHPLQKGSLLHFDVSIYLSPVIAFKSWSILFKLGCNKKVVQVFGSCKFDGTEITRKFGSMPLDSIIFTKLDESSSYGSVFNHAIRFKKPVSYLTTGQNVPEDIELATKERLVDLLLHISGT